MVSIITKNQQCLFLFVIILVVFSVLTTLYQSNIIAHQQLQQKQQQQQQQRPPWHQRGNIDSVLNEFRKQPAVPNDASLSHHNEHKQGDERTKGKNNDVAAGSNSMAACLLVMDDNHFLIEWLAYHYHVLPLRHLIVAVDPRSQNSPAAILDKWRKHMNITFWTDNDYFLANATERQEAEYWAERKFGADLPRALIQHRARQRLFYYHCLRQFKAMTSSSSSQSQQQQPAAPSWTVLIDSDEFLRINYQTLESKTTPLFRSSAPYITESGSVLSFLQQVTSAAEQIQSPGLLDNNMTAMLITPCIQIPRLRFGTVESISSPSSLSSLTNSNFNTSTFQTLRFRHHAGPDQYALNRISKTIIDVRRLPWEDLVPVESIHLPIASLCKRRKLHVRPYQHPLLLHHYLGTWEQYSFRNDARSGQERSWTSFQKAANVDQDGSSDDVIVPWIEGFVREMGLKRAQYLLQGVGQVPTTLTTTKT